MVRAGWWWRKRRGKRLEDPGGAGEVKVVTQGDTPALSAHDLGSALYAVIMRDLMRLDGKAAERVTTFEYHEIANLVGQIGLFDHQKAAEQLQKLKDEQADGVIDTGRHADLLQGFKLSPGGLAGGFYSSYLKVQQDLNFHGYGPLGSLTGQTPESF
jgi:hypothetical protein